MPDSHRPGGGMGQDTPPAELPQTSPPGSSAQDHWLPHHLNQLSADVAGLKEAVDTLKGTADRQTTAIAGIQKTIYIATGFVVGGTIIGGGLLGLIAWLVEKGFDEIAEKVVAQ